MASLSPSAKQSFLTNAGLPAAGYSLYTYATNTTTPLATYTDKAGTVANTNPIVLDARGEAILYLQALQYRYVLKDAGGSTIWTRDGIAAAADSSDLASTATGNGAALVAFLQSGVGAVARTVLDKDRDTWNVRDFGAKGDGSTDDTAAFLAAIAAVTANGGGRLNIPSGTFIISSTLTITNGITVVGAGVKSVPTSAGTNLKWAGAASGVVINVTGSIEGVELSGFGIDCNSVAGYGLVFDRQRFSSFKHLRIRNYISGGIYIYTTGTAGPNDNFMFNTFENIALESSNVGALGLQLRGTATGNPCHNTFTNVMITHANLALYLNDCDNNLFQQIICLQSFAVPYDVYLSGPTDTAYGARANYFVHLQGVIHATSGTKNLVFGYDRENGQAAPTVDAGAQLLVIGSGNNAAPWTLTERMVGLMSYLVGDPNTAATDVDPSVFGLYRGDLGAKLLWGINNAPREVRGFVSTDGTGPTQWLGITNSGVSMMRVGGMLQTSAAAMPTTGSWTTGDIVWSTVPSFGSMGAGNITVLGWRRMTTGSGNVLNTDWYPMRCLTGT